MTEPISETAYGDAPLSAAKNPDPSALHDFAIDGDKSDELIGRTVSINRPRAELYAFWRDLENLPLFMENIQSVTVADPIRSHWVVAAPGDRKVEWDSIITADEADSVIAWTSADGASVRNSGRIEFRDSTNGRGTLVTATIVYDPPGGSVGKALAKLFQREPNIQARRDLRRFKQLMETGEVSTSEPPYAAPRA
jgi:uncharacterized membrane protein